MNVLLGSHLVLPASSITVSSMASFMAHYPYCCIEERVIQ
uniref:Uncharacterized protein n=1 Tax=Anguilla anguilla TaxID=7936 RepID=A0A0E9RAF7_ANGAN